MLRRVADRGIGTPLVYGGGIKTEEQASAVIAQGADRILVDAIFYDQPTVVRRIASKLGAQAIIASVPLSAQLDGPRLWDYRRQQNVPWPVECKKLLAENVVSEILAIDKTHEGTPASFDLSLLNASFLRGCCLIPFGGISEIKQLETMLGMQSVSAVAVGNFLNYREHAVQSFKQAAQLSPIRSPFFASGEHARKLSI
jgi:cyclase